MRITNGDVSLSPSDLSAYLACRHLTTLELDFDAPHPAATFMTAGERRRRIDLALLRSEDFFAAKLPATEPGFTFDAFLEFAYLSD
jgi:hypothetical protein